MEPTEWPTGSQASCRVWREDSGLDSRPCRKRRPSSGDDGGVSWVFSSCGVFPLFSATASLIPTLIPALTTLKTN